MAAFDTNADGQFSSLDAQWGKFRVWQDKNEDGIQTPDELSTLAERGIASISLASNHVVSSAAGVTVNGIGSYTRIDGTQAQLADAQFAYTSETLASVSNDTVDLSITPVARLATGAGSDTITGSANADYIDAGTGNDTVMAGGGNDVVIGGAGNDSLTGGDGDDVLWGGKGADILSGDAGNDKLHGGSGDDYLSGGSGDDELWGDAGEDVLSGGAGFDTYHFALGDGNDLIKDSGGEGMRIVLDANASGQAISAQNIQAEALPGGSGYILRFSATDSLTVQNLGAAPFTPANVQISLADGTSVALAQLLAGTHTNHAPTLTHALTDQTANQARVWNYTVPAGTFADVDAGDVLSLSAKLVNGDALPIWLSFNATTGTFSGTPPTTSLGNIAIQVVATDVFGLTAASSFSVAVQPPVNRAPTVAHALTATNVLEDSAWTFTVPANTFADPDAGDVLSLSAKLANGDPLPAWLSFNATTRTFSGTPLNANVGTINIKVVATDAGGLTASSTFDVKTINTNDAPTVKTALANQSATSGVAFSYAVPTAGATAAFADEDVGDVLTLSAQLANGNPLPSWLSFNAATGLFSGTPPSTSVGTVSLQVTATDIAGAKVSSGFALAVAPPPDTTAPTLTSASPADNAAVVPVGSNLVLTFSEAIKAGAGNLRIVNAANAADTRTIAITDTTQVTVSGNSLTLNPTADLVAGASYSVQLATGVVLDLAGNAYAGIANATDLNFATTAGGLTPPPGALVGTPGKDVLTADSLHREVWGLGDNDTLNGFWDSTHLVGGAGNDILNAIGGAANVLDGGDGNDTLTGAWGNDTLIGGEGNNIIKVTGGAAIVTAGSGNDLVTGSWGDDKIDAGGGNNDINAGGGNNTILAGTGNDKIVADWGNDTINAGDGNNSISAGEGRNVIVCGDGNDTVDALGTNVVIAGAGNDNITLGWGNDWVEAGKGNDVIDAGGGSNLFAFNKGDGADTVVNSVWKADTLSLGGGIKYADLKLSKAGNDLVVMGAGSDSITLKDWYKASQNQGVGKLQVLTTGGDFDATSASTLKNKAVTVFDFDKLVKAFDAARTATPSVASGWAVSASLGAAQLYASTPIAAGYVNPWAALQAGTALLDKAPTAAINPIATSVAQSVDQLLFAALNASGNSNVAAGWVQA